MKVFIIFMVTVSVASFSYAESEKIDTTDGIFLKVYSESENFSDKQMLAKSRTSSSKKSRTSISSTPSTRSSSKKKKPYILKDGCKFTLYTDMGSSTVNSKESETSPVILEKSSIRIVIQNCKITENSRMIPVHIKKSWWKFW